MSSSGKLVVQQTFGVSPNIKNCLTFADDHLIAYICGHQVVLMNTETKDQSFISGISQSLGISAIACCVSKKLVAVADRCDPVATVTFYDSITFRRKKVLHYMEIGSKEVKCIAFSEDGKLCATQGAGPEWNLVLWNVEKTAKVLATAKISMSDDTPVHQISFCPWDPTVILVLGKSIFRLFRFADGQLRPSSLTIRRDHANFVSHSWLPDEKLVIGTEGGEILLLENLEFRAVVYPTGADDEEVSPILSFAPTSRGFVAGTTDGELKHFEKQEDIKEQFRYEESYHIPDKKGSVVSLALGGDDLLVCLTDTQQLFQFSLNHANSGREGHSGFEYLLTSFHGPNTRGDSTITGIDIAIWRPIIGSCGKDNTVRLWNLGDRKIEIQKTFDDEPTSISVHPSGMYVVVGFTEQIKLLSVLLDDLYVCREFNVRHCSAVKFSKGGHHIAAVSGSNIHVFSTYTGALVGVMRGHSGRPRALSWFNFDSHLMSIGGEGNAFFWDVQRCNRLPEQYVGITPFLAGAGALDGSKFFAATPEKTIREISFSSSDQSSAAGDATVPVGPVMRETDVGRVVSQMLMLEARKVLVVGTADDDRPGSVLTIQTTPQLNTVFETVDLHGGPITAMCLSYDGSTLVTADACGCICIAEFEGVIGKSQVKPREGTASYEIVEEVLIHRSELEKRIAGIQELTARVEELTLNNEHQLRLKEIEHNGKIKEISEKFSSQLESEHEKYDVLFLEKQDVERKYREMMDTQDTREEREIESINSKYKAKLNNEAARHKALVSETEETHRRWNDENKALVSSHQRYLQQLTEDYEDRLQAEHEAQQRLQAEKDAMQVPKFVCRVCIDEI